MMIDLSLMWRRSLSPWEGEWWWDELLYREDRGCSSCFSGWVCGAELQLMVTTIPAFCSSAVKGLFEGFHSSRGNSFPRGMHQVLMLQGVRSAETFGSCH